MPQANFQAQQLPLQGTKQRQMSDAYNYVSLSETKSLAYVALVLSKASAQNDIVSKIEAYLLKRLRENSRLTCHTSVEEGSGKRVILSATAMALYEMAEETGLAKPTKDGTLAKFSIHKLRSFANSEYPTKFFSPADAAELIRRELYAIRFTSDCAFQSLRGSSVLEAAHAVGLVDSCFPLHQQKTAEKLWNKWSVFSQPLDLMVAYLGPAVPYYFSFMSSYALALLLPAFFGLSIFVCDWTGIADSSRSFKIGFSVPVPAAIYNAVEGRKAVPIAEVSDEKRLSFSYESDAQSVLLLLFSIFMAFWGTLFLEAWKRKAARLTSRWRWISAITSLQPDTPSEWPVAMVMYSMETDMVTGSGHRRQRSAAGGGAAAGAQSQKQEDPAPGHPVLAKVIKNVQDASKRRGPPGESREGEVGTLFAYSASLFVLSSLVFLTVVLFWTLLEVGEHLCKQNSTLLCQAGTFLYLAVAFILESVYVKAAEWLTALENHGKFQTYQKSLIVKTVIFRVMNYVGYFAFVAFVLRDLELLRSQLFLYFCLKQWVQNGMEVVMPMVSAKAREKGKGGDGGEKKKKETGANASKSKVKKGKWRDRIAEEGGRDPVALSDEYLEVAIQFAVSTMFAAVFPLGPVFALVNCLFEIRVDSYKTIRLARRPFPLFGVIENDVWIGVFEALSGLAVVCNCFLVGLENNWGAGSIAVAEHMIIALKLYLAWSIPDTHEELRDPETPTVDDSTGLSARSPTPTTPVLDSPASAAGSPGVFVRKSVSRPTKLEAFLEDIETESELEFEDSEEAEERRQRERRHEQARAEHKVRCLEAFCGVWELDSTRSDSLDQIFTHLGMNIFKRTTINMSTPVMTITLSGSAESPKMNISTVYALGINRDVQLLLSGEQHETEEDKTEGSFLTRSEILYVADQVKLVTSKASSLHTIEESRQVLDVRTAHGALHQILHLTVKLRNQSLPSALVVNRVFRKKSNVAKSALLLAIEEVAGDHATPQSRLFAEVARELGPGLLKETDAEGEGERTSKAKGEVEGAAAVGEEEFTPEQIKQSEEWAELGKTLCEKIVKLSNEELTKENGWLDQGSSKTLKLFKKNVDGEPPIGRAALTLPASDGVAVEECLDYLWDADAKKEYDTMLERLILLNEFPNTLAVLYQGFYGRYGVSGRDLTSIVWKEKYSDKHMAIGSTSIEHPQTPEMNPNLVRGKLHLGGYDIRETEAGGVQITYYNQVDLGNIPEWILTGAKNDQLKVLLNVPKCLQKKHAEWLKKKQEESQKG